MYDGRLGPRKLDKGTLANLGDGHGCSYVAIRELGSAYMEVKPFTLK